MATKGLNGWWRPVVLTGVIGLAVWGLREIRAGDMERIDSTIAATDSRALRNTGRFERIDSILRVQAIRYAEDAVRDSAYQAEQQRVNEWVVKSIDQMMEWQGIPSWHREPLPVDTMGWDTDTMDAR